MELTVSTKRDPPRFNQNLETLKIRLIDGHLIDAKLCSFIRKSHNLKKIELISDDTQDDFFFIPPCILELENLEELTLPYRKALLNPGADISGLKVDVQRSILDSIINLTHYLKSIKDENWSRRKSTATLVQSIKNFPYTSNDTTVNKSVKTFYNRRFAKHIAKFIGGKSCRKKRTRKRTV
jgi:hypothetical protein